MDKLSCDRGEKERGTTTVTFTSFEEKASAKCPRVRKRLGCGSRNSRLACPGLSIQPEYMFAAGNRAPCRYLLEDIGSGTGVASRVIGIRMGIEGGSFDCAQFR